MDKHRADAVLCPVLEAALTRKDLETVLRVSGSTIDRLVVAGRLPAPFRVGRSARWRASDIAEFIGRRD